MQRRRWQQPGSAQSNLYTGWEAAGLANCSAAPARSLQPRQKDPGATCKQGRLNPSSLVMSIMKQPLFFLFITFVAQICLVASKFSYVFVVAAIQVGCHGCQERVGRPCTRQQPIIQLGRMNITIWPARSNVPGALNNETLNKTHIFNWSTLQTTKDWFTFTFWCKILPRP